MYKDELRVFLESGLVVTKTDPGVVNMQIMSLQNRGEAEFYRKPIWCKRSEVVKKGNI